MRKKLQIIFSSVFLLFISVIGVLTLFNNEYRSYTEGRELATFPEFSVNKILDKQYLDNLTAAFSDQLEFRGKFIKTYYLFNMQRYVGNVVKGKDNQLFAAPFVIKYEYRYLQRLERSARRINRVAARVTKNKKRKFIFLSIPRKDQVMTEYLPSTYIRSDDKYKKYMKFLKDRLSDDVILIDAMEVFEKHKGEADFYYKTDHHVNMRGAQLLYEEIMKIVKKDYPNIRVTDLDKDYEIGKVIINGSYNRQIGGSVNAGEEELLLKYKDNTLKYRRYDEDKKSDIPIFGDGNMYKVYMGGDMAKTLVKTNNKNAPNILFSGSSYTNILEAYSVASFKNVASVDYKQNHTGIGLRKYAREFDADYVVYVPGQSHNSFSIKNMRKHLGLRRKKRIIKVDAKNDGSK